MSHALIISALISLQVFSASSLLVSIPEPDRPHEVQEKAFLANGGFYGDVDIEKNPDMIAPVVQASSAIAIDRQSGFVLYDRHSFQRLPIASITKLMTVLLVLERGNLDDVVTISDRAAAIPGSKVWLYPGDSVTVRDLIKIAVIGSGNDGAYALAEYIGGTEEEFVRLMNERAIALNLGSSHFSNPVGFDDGENYSTAFEITLLAQELLKFDFFREVMATEQAQVISATGQRYNLKSTNELLDNDYYDVFGIKTGTTPEAGQSLVTIGRNDAGREVIVVVLNSPDRFHETKLIYDWIFRAYSWK